MYTVILCKKLIRDFKIKDVDKIFNIFYRWNESKNYILYKRKIKVYLNCRIYAIISDKYIK